MGFLWKRIWEYGKRTGECGKLMGSEYLNVGNEYGNMGNFLFSNVKMAENRKTQPRLRLSAKIQYRRYFLGGIT
jgi:hypothetical protein